MSPAEIIKLAKTAGIAQHGLGWTAWEGQLERFAALVAAKAAADEREAIRIALSAEAGGCELWPDEIDAVLRARSPQ